MRTIRRLTAICVLGLLAACTDGLPLDSDGGAADMSPTCGTLGAPCCDGADMAACAPGLYCAIHRGGGPPPVVCKTQP